MAGIAFLKVLQLFILIFVGFLLKQLRLFDETDARKIVSLNTYTFLPALIFYVIYTSEFQKGFALIPLIGLSIMAIMTVLSLVVGLLAGIREKKLLMPFVVASASGNTGYIGYPVALALFGTSGLAVAVTYDIFATVFYALVFAALLISYGAGKTESFTKLVVSVFTFPPTIAAILGLLFKSLSVPGFILDFLQFSSQAAIPLTLVALGMSLKPMGNIYYFRYLLFSVILKLVISPLIALGLANWFLDGIAAKVTVLQAGMPALMLTYILSVRYDTEPEYASFLVFFSTLTSMLTIPLLMSVVISSIR